MPEAASKRMVPDEFYAWLRTQDRRHELIDGVPILMAGANRRHDRITINALTTFDRHLGAGPCQTFSADTFVRIPAGNRRQADMGVDCGRPDEASLEADEPTLVLEVLSPTTRAFDQNDKLEEYKTVPSLRYVLLVDPDAPQVRLYRRADAERWFTERATGLHASIGLPLFAMDLRLTDLYARIEFRPRLSVVGGEGEAG